MASKSSRDDSNPGSLDSELALAPRENPYATDVSVINYCVAK